MTDQPHRDPDVFFLPLAVDPAAEFGGHDPWVLARRLPDFLHRLINQGQSGPAAMLEVQTPPEGDAPAGWARITSPPPADEAFGMLPPEAQVRVVIAGRLDLKPEAPAPAFGLELIVYDREQPSVETSLQAVVPAADPVAGLSTIAAHLAKLLGVPYRMPPEALMTHDGEAFYRFLAGLDGSALLSGDLEIEVRDDVEVLMRGYADALRIDPRFGLALRSAHVTLASAVEEARIGAATCCKLIDGYLAVGPNDGDACVQVAEYLAVLGEDDRAKDWLEHASHLSPPPPKSLENLGILCANSGDVVEARNLWLDGLDVDGHPDFFAHLARLAFAEEDLEDAWEKVLRGLRRIFERSVRASEWGESGRDLGLLLRYLIDHLTDHQPPPDVDEALLDLCDLLGVSEDRLDLGQCLWRLGHAEEARAEIAAGLAGDVDSQYRVEGLRVLLGMEVPGFDEQFAATVEQLNSGSDPRAALADLEYFLELQPEFWPAMYFRAVGLKRLGDEDAALDCLAELLRAAPGQPEALAEMAALFDARDNPKRALECIEEAVRSQPDEPQHHAAMAGYYLRLHRPAEAMMAIESALELAPDDEDLLSLRDEIAGTE